MLSYNCLIQNTKLYQELQKYVKEIMYQRAAEGKNVSIRSIYADTRNNSTISDVDLNTVGEMYKEIAPQLSQMTGKGVFDSDFQVDKVTGKTIKTAISKIISNKKNKQFQEVGELMPATSVTNDLLKLFTSDYIDNKDVNNKTVMRDMQDAIKKAAVALLKRDGKKTENKTIDEVLKEAFRVDNLSVTDIHGQLNTMDDLFNQVDDEVNKVLVSMENSKRGMSQAKKDEIDMRIEQFRNYAENIKQGAYTLALSTSEQQKVLRGILKEGKYGKDVFVNGLTKRVLDYNKLFSQSTDLRQDLADVLIPKGYTPKQIDKIAASLKVQYDKLRASSQWKNISSKSQAVAVNDAEFISRAAAQVVMSKKSNDGTNYSKYDTSLKREVPDYEKWQKERNQTLDELKTEIQNVIQNTPAISVDNYLMALKDKDGNKYQKKDSSGNVVADWNRYATDKGITEQEAMEKITKKVSTYAAQYRQVVSNLARMNNPAKHITKSDLEKLSEMAERNEFNDLFNAKVYKMLGLSEKDTEAGRKIEELGGLVKEVLDKGGKGSKVAMSKILDHMNYILSTTQNQKSTRLALARQFEWWMGNRNAYRISNYLNLVENSLSGISQITQTIAMAESKKAAMIELGKMMNVGLDVAGGGKHFDMTDSEKISYQSHEYRFDPSKSAVHNLKSAMAVIPNLALGVLDSMAHAYTMRMMFYNSAVKLQRVKYADKERAQLVAKGASESEIKKQLSSLDDKFREMAINDVTNALYDDTAEKAALQTAQQILKLTTPNPTALEVKRESDNIMFQNMVAKGLLNQGQLEALINAADTGAKKAIGKESSISLNPLTEGIRRMQQAQRSGIQKAIQEGDYNKAANKILVNAIVMKGIFPFISGASNWGVIAGKKLGLGFYRGYLLTKENFKNQMAEAANMDDKKLEKIMESYNTRRNDLYLSISGMVWTSAVVAGLMAMKAASGDDDDFFTWFNDEAKKLSKDSRKRKMLLRWLPPVVQVYNLVNDNAVGDTKTNAFDLAGQLFGYAAMESPITKALKYNSPKHAMAGFGQMVGGIVDVGTYWNWINSYGDLYGEEQKNKAVSHDTYLGKQIEANDFVNGIIAGMTGYNLNQDINNYMGYKPKK